MLLSACGGSSTLAPRIEWLLFVFCGPKTGARFWTQKWGHNTKISSPASKFVALVSGPWYMRFAFFKSALSCDTLHLFHSCFLALGARMLVSQDIYNIYILYYYIYIYIRAESGVFTCGHFCHKGHVQNLMLISELLFHNLYLAKSSKTWQICPHSNL